MKRIIWLLLLALLAIPSLAQDSFTEYSWTFADISFRYPSSWGEPVQRFVTESGRVNMMLAQTQVDSPETRPPAIPFITVSLLREVTEEINIYAELENDLEAIGINPIGTLPGSLLGKQSIATRGLSSDGQLFGIGQALELDDGLGILIIYGRTVAAQRDSFVGIFNAVANSLTLSASSGASQPDYGVLWHQTSSVLDGEEAFLDLAGIAYAPNGNLYAIDAVLGLLEIDAETGLITDQIALGDFLFPSDIAIASDNTIYVSDLACNCIHVIVNGTEINIIEGFSMDAPESIAVTADNVLYATDFIGDEVVIKAYGESDSEISFDVPTVSQPFLTVDRLGELVGLVDSAIVYKIFEGVFSEQYQLSTNIFATAITVDFANNLVVATEGDGLVVFNAEGHEVNRIGRATLQTPQAGETLFPIGVTSAPDTIYWVDSDGSYGNITAMSLNVEAGRVGSTNIQAGNIVQGVLDSSISKQLWTFDGLVGDIVTLTAISDFLSSDLDLTIRLLAPDGHELAFVDHHEDSTLLNPFDPQIDNLTLRQDGQYIVIVETLFGEGRYSLGLSVSETLDVSSGQAEVTGAVSEALPVQRWLFDGRGGQTVEISMISNSSTLDPMLVLLSPNGNRMEENDDAFASTLGLNAQITGVSLPSNGQYVIEARRFDGEGTYQLSIELE